jgi:hypothetical protein
MDHDPAAFYAVEVAPGGWRIYVPDPAYLGGVSEPRNPAVGAYTAAEKDHWCGWLRGGGRIVIEVPHGPG